MKKYNILIADDEEDFLKMISIRMDSLGYGYSVVTNGEEVLEYCKKQIPDLIILDVMMPKLDGIKTLHELKADDKLRDIPVIVLTAGRFDISEELDDLATANDFMLKTIDIKVVLEKMAEILKTK